MVFSKKNPVYHYEIVFVGRSNVGKSTLIRNLTGRAVPVGRRPGVTLKPLHLQFGDLLVTDMPGFGFMSGVTERKQDIIKTRFVRYMEQHADRIIFAVLVVDGGSFAEVVDRWEGRGEVPIEIEMYQFLNDLGIEVIVAVNKTDKITDIDYVMDGVARRLGMLPPWRQWLDVMAPVSAKKDNIQSLKSIIKKKIHNMGRDDLLGWIR